MVTPPLTPAADALDINYIDSLSEFEAVRATWDALYARDPDAMVFLAWSWLAEAFQSHDGPWTVITVTSRDTGALIAALPLKLRVHWSPSRKRLETELEAATRLFGAPSTGLLCDPVIEDKAVAMLAQGLAEMPWQKLTLAPLPYGTRAETLANLLAREDCSVRLDGPDSPDTLRRMHSRILPLPDRLTAFFDLPDAPGLGQRFTAWFKDLQSGDRIRLEMLDAQRLPALWDALEALAEESADPRAPDRLASARPQLEMAAKQQALFCPIVFKDGHLVAAMAHVLGAADDTMVHVLTLLAPEAQDSDFGLFLRLTALHRAIKRGAHFYDFGRVSRRTTAPFSTHPAPLARLSAKREETEPHCFDPCCTQAALLRIRDFVAQGKAAEAMAACTQLSEIYEA